MTIVIGFFFEGGDVLVGCGKNGGVQVKWKETWEDKTFLRMSLRPRKTSAYQILKITVLLQKASTVFTCR